MSTESLTRLVSWREVLFRSVERIKSSKVVVRKKYMIALNFGREIVCKNI